MLQLAGSSTARSFGLQSRRIARPPHSAASWFPLTAAVRTSAPRLHLSTLTDNPEEPNARKPRTLAIIGGGLSGLSTAHYYLRSLSPRLRAQTRIVVLEGQDRVGGWCRAVKLQENRLLAPGEALDPSKGSLVLETGPRSIRPVGLLGWLTVELAHDIGLSDKIITVAKSAPSAKNRYLFTPPRLTRLPSSLASAFKALFTVPLIRRVVPSILLEPFRPRSRLHADPLGDESVDAFFRRRFGPVLAEEMISAMIHGIYAGDTRRLSVRAVFPQLWEAEREWGSVVLAGLFGSFARRRGWKEKSPWRVRAEREDDEVRTVKVRLAASHADGGHRLVKAMEGASVWGLRGGLEVLTDQLKAHLERQGVEFWLDDQGKVERVEKVQDGSWRITTKGGAVDSAQLVTTIPHVLPAELAPPSIPSTTVAVINLVFPAPSPSEPPLFPPGFGYLIPRTVPTAQNPHHVLGVLFDSDVMPKVDTSRQEGLVKVSVLLGGSYWLDKSPVPSLAHGQLVAAALETIRLHFPASTIPEPLHAFTHLQRDCIPQVPPNSLAAFRAFGERLKQIGGGSVAVVGGGYSAVGVNGCVKAAWEVGTAMAEARNGELENGEAGEKVAKPIKTGTEMWEL